MIGTFGNIVFETSQAKILTFDNFKRSGSASFAEHPVLDDKPRLQHTGTALDEITFSVSLNKYLGVSPADELQKFRDAKDRGEALKLMIGGKSLGDFVLTRVDDTWQTVDNQGRPVKTGLELTIREFVHGT
ncbi:MAG: phage tail protein [Desulfobacterales bacterium]|nr:phage tail protein [Desulfobacterales bacterium]